MSLQDDLYSSALRWAATALIAYATDPPDYDFAVHHMAVAVEHLSKAYLCSVSEVLLVGDRPSVDDLLLLAGRGDKTSRQRVDLKTIGGAEAVARAERLLGRRPPNPDALRRLREARNGVTHLGHNEDPAQNRDLLGAGIEYINELLAELAKEPALFWDANERLANDLVGQAVTDLELRYQHKLRQARQLFEQRFGNVHDEARTMQIAALSAVPVLTRWLLVAPMTCPVCGSPAMASGREYSEDFGSWFSPRFFGCRVCELRLEGEELRLAGIDQEFFARREAERLEELYRGWEPDEDDYERMAAAEEYGPDGLDERNG
jgi:hypothetical protein